jgi:hypothetical protein
MPLALTTSFLDAERSPSAQVVAGLAPYLSNLSDFALVPRVGLFTSRVGLFTPRVGLFVGALALLNEPFDSVQAWVTAVRTHTFLLSYLFSIVRIQTVPEIVVGLNSYYM